MHPLTTRRAFVKGAAAIGAASLLPDVAQAAQDATKPAADSVGPRAFRFVHLTDIHVQPELKAAEGFARALKAVESLSPRPDFILTGGDLVMDVFEVGPPRAKELFDLYRRVIADHTSIPVRNTIGNHDVFGWSRKQGVTPETAGYGRALVQEQLQLKQTYYRFDHKGWRFFVLDNIQPRGDVYQGFLDATQRDWLEAELKATDAAAPIVICEHIPALTVTTLTSEQSVKDNEWRISNGLMCSDTPARLRLYATRNVRLCLSGHIHQCDRIEYRGTTYINGGAVCGAWWKGPHRGFEEGFGVIDVWADGRFDYRYHDYGWNAER
ncbi:MAG: metallophosphoesterase [Phycisphaerae bacterium]|nr:metallophosphoesterase [Phycisphaerae bacterium]NUQ45926.1 metallophosphoesterase [Phycisphaerae bacterium]